MAQQARVFAAKLRDLSLIPRTHMDDRKNWLIKAVLAIAHKQPNPYK